MAQTALQYLLKLHNFSAPGFGSTETKGIATNGEIRRWVERGALWVNGIKLAAADLMPPPYLVHSVVLFPNNQRFRRTIL